MINELSDFEIGRLQHVYDYSRLTQGFAPHGVPEGDAAVCCAYCKLHAIRNPSNRSDFFLSWESSHILGVLFAVGFVNVEDCQLSVIETSGNEVVST